ncbi:hypothetical protein Gpo141_00009648 [Globisporangium polare]
MAAATTPDAAVNPKKQKRREKTASGNAKKPRASPPAKQAKQSNTLDMWFKKAAPKAPAPSTPESEDDTKEKAPASENGSSNSDSAPTAPIEELTKVTPPVQKKKVMDAASSSSRKLVQRRIHINDPCRVCESARTEDVSRCELRCLGCDMTVHKKCYDVESEDPIDDWHCRRCQCITDKKEELESADADATPAATESDSALLPTHEPLGKAHKYHELHGDSDFATIFQFLKRFRRMGLKISLDINLKNLADALTEPTATKFIQELHLRLLANVEATISKNHDWTVSLARFLAGAEHRPSSPKLDAFVASASNKKDPQAADATCVKLYAALSASERVMVLKFLCEAQFDDNEALVERIGDQEGDSLRDEPVGVDSSGRTYWALEDLPSVLEGTVWVCRCATPKQDDDDDDMDGSLSQWETVTDDLETLESLIEWLSLSSETADLQLWQHFSSGILKSLVRRDKKAQQSTARLARMPRLLGGVSSSSGLDLGSIVDDDGFGVRRSTRSRRAVSYRIAESEDEEEAQEQEEEEEANDSDEEEEEEENEDGDANDEEDEERPSKRPRRSATTQQQRKPKRAEPEPSRRSSRLRGGGDADKSPSRASRDEAASSPSPLRRRSDRRVAADARSSGRSLRSTRRRAAAGDSEDDDTSSSDEDEVEE